MIILIVIAGIISWQMFFSGDGQKQVDPQSQAARDAKSVNNEPSKLGGQELSETYTNDFLRLTFKHPKNWAVKDQNDIITITSPQFKYTLKDGSEKEGFFKLYIRQSSTPSEGQYLGRGFAVEQSEKMIYSDPAEGQKKETYLTNFGLDSSNNFAYFVVQGNFALAKDESLGPKFASEPGSYLIAGGFGSADIESPLQTNLLSLSSFKNEQEYKTAIEIAKSLQLK